jgi:hypothetical protein
MGLKKVFKCKLEFPYYSPTFFFCTSFVGTLWKIVVGDDFFGIQSCFHPKANFGQLMTFLSLGENGPSVLRLKKKKDFPTGK